MQSKTLLKKMVGVDNIAESYDAALSMYEKSREELPTLPQYSPGTKYAESREFFTQAQTAVQQIVLIHICNDFPPHHFGHSDPLLNRSFPSLEFSKSF